MLRREFITFLAALVAAPTVSRAAKETTDMIEVSLRNVSTGTEIAERTADALTQIVDRTGKVSALVAEISAASDAQAEGIAEINEGLSQIDGVTRTNTASAKEIAERRDARAPGTVVIIDGYLLNQERR